jgi:hypothetical protein
MEKWNDGKKMLSVFSSPFIGVLIRTENGFDAYYLLVMQYPIMDHVWEIFNLHAVYVIIPDGK